MMIYFLFGSANGVGEIFLKRSEVRLAGGVVVHVIFKLVFGQTVT